MSAIIFGGLLFASLNLAFFGALYVITELVGRKSA